MPWRERSVFDERNSFITEFHCRKWPMALLCRAFGISRKTGYKILARYRSEHLAGLYNRSSAPHHRPNKTDPAIVELLLAEKKKHENWGPRKLLVVLQGRHPELRFPAASTAGEILKKNGMVEERHVRRKCPPTTTPLSQAAAPNDVWCGDFKGWFRVRDGKKCEPLTITDASSRFLLLCRNVKSTKTQSVKSQFETAFREYGLPRVIRTDNGPPFASQGLAGLSALSVWWLRLNILPERIAPGHPEQNGRHERMHLTLKMETVVPPAADLLSQQKAFDHFTYEYNFERPHEALGNRTPGEVYYPSVRLFPRYLKEFSYPRHFEHRRISETGDMKWNNGLIYVSRALAGEIVGLELVGEDQWVIHLGPVEIALLNDSHREIVPYRRIQLATNRVLPTSPV